MASSGIQRKSEFDTAPALISIVYKYIGPHVIQQVIYRLVNVEASEEQAISGGTGRSHSAEDP